MALGLGRDWGLRVAWVQSYMLYWFEYCLTWRAVFDKFCVFFQEHVDRAIELSPDVPLLHNLNGHWCFRIAGLSWLQKKAAAAIFATPPEATYEQALESFMKCEELSPGTWKANMLMVAKVRKQQFLVINAHALGK